MDANKDIIQEVKLGNLTSFVIEDDNSFMATEYKVLQNQDDSIFARCVKLKLNGKVQMIYLTAKYPCLSSIWSTLTIENITSIVKSCIKKYLQVKNNGFLSVENLKISPEHLFIDTNDFQVKFLYLPVCSLGNTGSLNFETSLRHFLANLLIAFNKGRSNQATSFSAELLNLTLSIDDVFSRHVSPLGLKKNHINGFKKILELYSTKDNVRIRIDRDNFILGKISDSLSGINNPAISRKHCKIDILNSVFLVTDLSSVNGTYINHKKIPSETPMRINNGDILSLANTDFNVFVN